MNTINISIDDKLKQFYIPENWDEVTVKQYRQLVNINVNQSLLLQRIDVVMAMLNIDRKTINLMSEDDFVQIEKQIEWIISLKKMTNELEEKYLQWTIGDMPEYNEKHIVIDDETYFFKPLVSLNVGEKISLEILLKNSNNDLTKCYNELLCLICRKKNENGKLENWENEMMDRKEMFDNQPFYKFNGMMVFFSKSDKE